MGYSFDSAFISFHLPKPLSYSATPLSISFERCKCGETMQVSGYFMLGGGGSSVVAVRALFSVVSSLDLTSKFSHFIVRKVGFLLFSGLLNLNVYTSKFTDLAFVHA